MVAFFCCLFLYVVKKIIVSASNCFAFTSSHTAGRAAIFKLVVNGVLSMKLLSVSAYAFGRADGNPPRQFTGVKI